MIVTTARKSTTVYTGTTSSGTILDGTAVGVLRNTTFDLAPVALDAVTNRIGMLKWRVANWDGYGSAKPNSLAVDSARNVIREFFRGAALTQYGWSDPYVGANESGDVVLEWWQGNRKVTVYVAPTEMTYVLVWGDNMETEMDEGTIGISRDDFMRIWSWLHN